MICQISVLVSHSTRCTYNYWTHCDCDLPTRADLAQFLVTSVCQYFRYFCFLMSNVGSVIYAANLFLVVIQRGIKLIV